MDPRYVKALELALVTATPGENCHAIMDRAMEYLAWAADDAFIAEWEKLRDDIKKRDGNKGG